ncbi:MAG: flagellar brake protein [Thiobacillaceae bacterium]|nr:flagellar brake protein [Thiobacillaceae bacterium]
MSEDLIPVQRAEIVIGEPLPWSVYDANHVLLVHKGVVIGSEIELQNLMEKGPYREALSPSPAAPRGEGMHPEMEGGAVVPFERIRLTPGDLVQLKPLQEGASERYNVHYLGMLKGRSLMVTTPVVEDKVLFIREGQLFLVRAFAGLDVCGFKAQVLASHMRPYPYLHLKYPAEVHTMRVRRALRANVDIIVAVYDRKGGRLKASGRIVDLSVGGARVYSPQVLAEQGGTIFLSFKVVLDEIEEIVTTPAIVRSIAHEIDAKGQPAVVSSLQFTGLSTAQRLVVMNLVYRQLFKEG